jgi:hypothetical protein
MPAAARLKRVLLSLPGPQFRLNWLHDRLATLPSQQAAHELNALCEEGERSVPEAREALLAVAMLFAGLGDCELVEQLRAEASTAHLLSLERLLRRGPRRRKDEHACEDLPVPDYGAGRELTVGERRSLARRPDRRVLEKLLNDPHPLVMRQLLRNPKLTEDDVVQLASRRPARSVAIEAIVSSPRWLSQQRVRMSLLLNPGAPASAAVPLLVLCTRQ